MTAFVRASLESQGFLGYVSVAELARPGGTRGIPVDPGAYVVLRAQGASPRFVDPGSAGWFKGRDPNVRIEALRAKWVPRAHVVYIGKATSLQSRIDQLIKFGHGRDIGHQGGRYLWQLADAPDLLLAWDLDRDPGGRESELLRAFVEAYGAFPFANLRW